VPIVEFLFLRQTSELPPVQAATGASGRTFCLAGKINLDLAGAGEYG
jgi:hypothetical protein